MKLIPVAPVHGMTRFLMANEDYFEFYLAPPDTWVAIVSKVDKLSATTSLTRTGMHSTNPSLVKLVVDIMLE